MGASSAPLAVLLLAAAAGAIQSRQIPRSFGPGRCGPIDAAYVRTAADTGGQPFPLAPSEVAQMGLVMAESSRGDSVMLLWAGGSAADAQAGYLVAVDRSVKRLTFSITFDGRGGSVEVAGPNGAVVEPGAGPGDTILNCGRILSVEAPEPGGWRVTPAPSSRFWMVAHGRSDRDLLTAEFVRRSGRPGHEGLFRIDGSPIAGRPAMLRVALSEPPEQLPVFQLLSAQGRPIQRAALDRVGDAEFVGEIELPRVPFRVGVSGTDADGFGYQRIDARLFHAASVEVVPPLLDEVRAGADVPMVFALRNHGEPASYRVTATVGGEVLTRIEPPALVLSGKAEQRVTVWLPARTIAAAGSSLELLLVASSEDPNLSSTNSALLRLAVVTP